MKKTTKLVASFLILTTTILLFSTLTLVSADEEYNFTLNETVVLTGEYFEIDYQKFTLSNGQLFVDFEGDWYFIVPGNYSLEDSPWPETAHIQAHHTCGHNGTMYVCDSGTSGSGGGAG